LVIANFFFGKSKGYQKVIMARGNNRKNKRQKQSNHDDVKEVESKNTKNLEEEVFPLASLSADAKYAMIAELCENIMEDPSQAFKQERETTLKENGEEGETTTVRLPSKIQNLLDLARPHKNGGDDYVAALAVMSLLALFKDIVPSYRIRLVTDAERAGKVSNETKQLWDYERAMLTYYQQYLQLLEIQWERGQNQQKEASRLAMTAMLSLCELLKTAYHFNFRSNILTMVVRQMNNRSCDNISDACCQAVEYVFQKDSQGEVSMEAARLVAKLIKEYRGVLRPAVVRTFAKLPLRVHVDEAQAAKLAAVANKKKRKRDKGLTDIESDLKEGTGEIDKIVLARCQSETLQSVTLTYFRILKSPDTKTKKDLLPVALEGLAKFVHLINMDTVVDLLDILKQLLVDVGGLPLEASLNCALTAFQALQGPGRELQIDQKEYIIPLYSQLARLGTEENSRANTEKMLKCLTAAFIKRREYSMVRVAAFVKQIFTVSMHVPSSTSVPLIALARQILQRYPAVHQMLDSESDVITCGQYTPDVEDPEHSNPFSTSAWEISTLKFHIHPSVSGQTQAASVLKMLQMPGESPDRLWADMKKDLDEVYIKFRRSSKRHPLVAKGNRQQFRFITPRKKEITLLEIPEDD
jgi:nucleolar complex protein 3